MKLTMDLGPRSYDIIIKRGALGRVGMLANLTGRVLLVTDEGIPAKYVRRVLAQCGQGQVVALKAGHLHKSMEAWHQVLAQLQAGGFCRGDMVVTLGGGTVSNVGGFAAACYQRGTPVCHLPTTTAGQLGAAVGGRTGIDVAGGIGNVGAFYQPQLVAVDPELLSTLPARHRASGLVQAVKTGLVASRELYEALEAGDGAAAIERVIYLCLRAKKTLVEQDEQNQRGQRLLDFGATVGLALQQVAGGEGGLLPGECAALGMLPMIESRTLLRRTRALLKKLGLPLRAGCDKPALLEAIRAGCGAGGLFQVVRVKQPGQGYIETMDYEELRLLVDPEG